MTIDWGLLWSQERGQDSVSILLDSGFGRDVEDLALIVVVGEAQETSGVVSWIAGDAGSPALD